MREQIESHRVFVQTGLSAQADEIESMLRNAREDDRRRRAVTIRTSGNMRRKRLSNCESNEKRSRVKQASRWTTPWNNADCEIASKAGRLEPSGPERGPESAVGGQSGRSRSTGDEDPRGRGMVSARLGSLRDQAQSTISEIERVARRVDRAVRPNARSANWTARSVRCSTVQASRTGTEEPADGDRGVGRPLSESRRRPNGSRVTCARAPPTCSSTPGPCV